MAGKILVLGSSNVDFILATDRFHGPGETIQGENVVTVFGGKGANQAVAAKRLGGAVRFLTRLGNDFYGKSYLAYLVRSGFEKEYLLRDRKLPTGMGMIQRVPGGENRIIVSPGANRALSSRDLKAHAACWDGVSIFVTQLEIPLTVVEAALKAARCRGVTTVLNPAPAASLPESFLSLVDFLVPNESEAQLLTGVKIKKRSDLPRAAKRFLRQGVRHVVVTLGARGCYYHGEQEAFALKGFRVKAVDTTAAGDAFVGALACGLAEGKPIREALRMANAAGALAATKAGAQPSLPSRRVLDKFCEVSWGRAMVSS